MKRIRPCHNPDCNNNVPRPRRLFCCERCSKIVHGRIYRAKERSLDKAVAPVVQMRRYEPTVVVTVRVCHECKRPTPDYRCPECLAKWRAKHGVSRSMSGEDF